jgi:hypothetical protein
MWNYKVSMDPAGDLPDEWVWERLRNRRNALLAACDWTQTADSPVDTAAWAAYRKALRDLPATTSDPREAVWPEEPLV